MRIGELSRLAGVPVATTKYYLRENLLPPGELTSRNQAQYGEEHLRRLKLVRALIEVGGLSVAATRQVVEQITSPEITTYFRLGKVAYALTPRRDHPQDERWAAAEQETEALIQRRGWRIRPNAPARTSLAQAIMTLRELNQDDLLELLDLYADCGERLGTADVETVSRRPDVESMLQGVVLDVVLGDVLIHALRRLAQEDATGRMFGPIPEEC